MTDGLLRASISGEVVLKIILQKKQWKSSDKINWNSIGFVFIHFALFSKLAHDQNYTTVYVELLEDLRGIMLT